MDCPKTALRNFNSHAHVERDNLKTISREIDEISTHTLTWSVTCICHLINEHSFNFNSHAHVERDGRHGRYSRRTSEHFNSHAHVERDIKMADYYDYDDISTHTLTWSVTRRQEQPCDTYQNFNSHAHVERDVLLRGYFPPVSNFNSHAHVERDRQYP